MNDPQKLPPQSQNSKLILKPACYFFSSYRGHIHLMPWRLPWDVFLWDIYEVANWNENNMYESSAQSINRSLFKKAFREIMLKDHKFFIFSHSSLLLAMFCMHSERMGEKLKWKNTECDFHCLNFMGIFRIIEFWRTFEQFSIHFLFIIRSVCVLLIYLTFFSHSFSFRWHGLSRDWNLIYIYITLKGTLYHEWKKNGKIFYFCIFFLLWFRLRPTLHIYSNKFLHDWQLHNSILGWTQADHYAIIYSIRISIKVLLD